MGILNTTPDSFSDGGDHAGPDAALARAARMAEEADIIDIGGESTRPGASEVPITEEIARTAPVIAAMRDRGITTPISIDTRKARVAEAALDAGADMVNDVSAFHFDPELADLVSERAVPVCLMHAQGLPETMQRNPRYGDVVEEVFASLEERIVFACARGIARANIITDPGIGFGKTLEHNLALMRNIARFHDLGAPILLGASRKRFIDAVAGAPEAKDRLGGSLSVALHAAAQGVQILRVHDTYETTQALKLWRALNDSEKEGWQA
jgi:dihydropteroate synthase